MSIDSFALNRKEDTPLYLQIRYHIREQILSGDIETGTRLPPERTFAEALGVNRTTVAAAYQELAADGLVKARVGSGTLVLPVPVPHEPAESMNYSQPLAWNELFTITGQIRDSQIKDLLALCAQPDVISLAGGVPAPDHFPVDQFIQALDSMLGKYGQNLLQYSPTEGHCPLRETLTEMPLQRGIRTSADNILVVAGSQQGLDLITRSILNPGDTVFVETPSYLGAISLFRAAGVRVLGIPTDRDGMDMDVLERQLDRYRPKLIYTLPAFQNPSGTVMSRERKAHLLALAQRHQVAIVEDDPYGELFFDSPPPQPIKSLDETGHVIYLSTFSKILFPGIRVGWLVAPRPVIQRLSLVKQHADLSTNTPAQWALTEFIQRGWLDEHLQHTRPVYKQRCHALQACLRAEIPNGMRWNQPAGGFYLWCQLDGNLQAIHLLSEAVERGVAFISGEPFYADGGGRQSLRLNFTYSNTKQLQEGARRLGQALNALIARQKERKRPKLGIVRPLV